MLYGQVGLYIILLLLKNIFSKCLIYKSSTGQLFVIEQEKAWNKCVNGVLLKSSYDGSLTCLPDSTKILKNESLSCVMYDDLKIRSDKDYINDDDGDNCKCGQENHRNHQNRIMFPEEIKPHSYPWVVKIFRYCKFEVFKYL